MVVGGTGRPLLPPPPLHCLESTTFILGVFRNAEKFWTESKSINYFLVYVNQSKFTFLQLLVKKIIIICPCGPVEECWISDPKVAGSILSETP